MINNYRIYKYSTTRPRAARPTPPPPPIATLLLLSSSDVTVSLSIKFHFGETNDVLRKSAKNPGLGENPRTNRQLHADIHTCRVDKVWLK
jgi:hypothetical protein